MNYFKGKTIDVGSSSKEYFFDSALECHECDEDLKALRQACGQEKAGTPRGPNSLIFGSRNPVESDQRSQETSVELSLDTYGDFP